METLEQPSKTQTLRHKSLNAPSEILHQILPATNKQGKNL